ncbi:MAG TPA: rod shape-determining protein RodA [Planctomycetota bacterium]|nr:rod shape-determining protein RodA [Planctomycetota bacterium]
MRLFDSVDYRRISWPTIMLAGMLLAIGLAFVFSASTDGGPQPQKQVVWSIVGLFVFLVVILIDYKLLVDWAYVIYGAGLVLLLATLFLASPIKGSRRWIDLGPAQLQTSEFMKIAVIFALARFLPGRDSYRELIGLLSPFIIVIVPIAFIAKQPDLGTSLVLLPVFLGMVFVAGARVKHLITFVLMGILALPVLWFMIEPYQKERVISFINQDSKDPALLMDELYHLTQAKVAIGSGGLTGKGWGQGTQNRLNFLPERNTDFIFAVICEEWGFLRAVGVLALFFLFFCSCASVADATRDPPGRLLVVGVMLLFATQMLVNTGMSAGQFPTVGLPLPFMSYGGSSLLASFVGLGLVVNVSMRPQIVLGREMLDEIR